MNNFLKLYTNKYLLIYEKLSRYLLKNVTFQRVQNEYRFREMDENNHLYRVNNRP